MALSEAKKDKTTKHVEACLEASRDGGSNPPASSSLTSFPRVWFARDLAEALFKFRKYENSQRQEEPEKSFCQTSFADRQEEAYIQQKNAIF